MSLYQANKLVKDMEKEEYYKISILKDAIKAVVESAEIDENAGSNSTFTFASQIISQNKSIPLILTDETGAIQTYNNIDTTRIQKDSTFLNRKLAEFKKDRPSISIDFGYGKQYLYYGDSDMLVRIKRYPIILISIILVFILILFVALYNAQNSIQNQLWVGMSKETAHQMGTPLTSVVAWMELLKENEDNKVYIQEMERDVERLQLVADRFSKIGSVPQLKEEDLMNRLRKMVNYMQTRAPLKVKISLHTNENEVEVLLIGPLFDWVIENLIRNSLDAMEGEGEIKIIVNNQPRRVTIDVCDTGKGISKDKIKKIFRPGYSTKTRGWGLGLSLSKRIIHKYHNGSISVKNSEIGNGTTFRIILWR